MTERWTMTKKDIITTLASLKAQARDQYKAEIKGIFGSFARDEDKAESDIDTISPRVPAV